MNSWSDFNAAFIIEREKIYPVQCLHLEKVSGSCFALYPLHFYVGSIDENISWSNSR